MMPIGDDNSGHTIRPYVNYLLIAANIVVFIFFFSFIMYNANASATTIM